MRCFVGIELDSGTRCALADACASIRAVDHAWAGEKWVRPENLHLTVAFLGEIEDQVVAPLAASIEDRVREAAVFAMPFVGLRAVSHGHNVSMIWAAYGDPDGRAASLTRDVAVASEPFGIDLEHRAFKAHVTLVRARRPHHVAEETLALLEVLGAKAPALLSVPSVTLFSSTLTKAGPIYRPLATWEFAPSETSS